jgi:hypothetical protein
MPSPPRALEFEGKEIVFGHPTLLIEMSTSISNPFEQLNEDGSMPKQSDPTEDKSIEDNKKQEPPSQIKKDGETKLSGVTIETQSDIKLLEARVATADARVASIKECMSNVMDDSQDKTWGWAATRWGTVAGALASAAIATTFLSAGRTNDALCVAGVMTTASGAHFLTEGAMRQYYRNKYPGCEGCRDATTPISNSVQMGLGVVGIVAGIGYLFLSGKQDK